jgi:hypothetical protein
MAPYKSDTLIVISHHRKFTDAEVGAAEMFKYIHTSMYGNCSKRVSMGEGGGVGGACTVIPAAETNRLTRLEFVLISNKIQSTHKSR